jgi:hypothetical protein
MEALSFPIWYSWMHPSRMCSLYRRTSSDGVTFRVRPENMSAAEAEVALETSPHSYSADPERFAPWPPGGYSNVT